jgi:uncharacterized membrane protein YedE/YeeE
MQFVSALLVGLLFGLGLVVSGMADPLKVQNFLDPIGTWDPSLAFVMAGAILVALPGFRLVRRRAAPLFAARFRMPTRSDIDSRLIAGAAVFGIGWGLAGYCPGPVLTAVPLGAPGTLVFVPAMFLGIFLARLTRPREGFAAAAR